jgi:hypothetical protein
MDMTGCHLVDEPYPSSNNPDNHPTGARGEERRGEERRGVSERRGEDRRGEERGGAERSVSLSVSLFDSLPLSLSRSLSLSHSLSLWGAVQLGISVWVSERTGSWLRIAHSPFREISTLITRGR